MATNKNQHFVPRCYLRPFTIDEANTAINLYNIDRQEFIPLAPIKNQCSRDYFYGKNETLERAIQSVERAYGAALREILRPGYTLTDAHRTILRTFWLFQYLRTEAAAIRSVEIAASMGEVAGTTDPSFRLAIKEAVIIAMHTFAQEMHIIDDLKICIIRNKTPIPFFTSDDPAVLTNRWWLNSKRTKGHSFGLRSAGSIILLPLSTKLQCLGYDGDVYSVPHDRGMVDVRRESDIRSFNQHQFLNCRANLFVKDAAHSSVVHEAFAKAAKNRPTNRHIINYAVRDHTKRQYTRYRVVDPKENENHAEALLHTQVIHPMPLSWPSQITTRNKGAVFTNGTGLGYVRYSATAQPAWKPFYKESP
jgi:hypothetical protein